MSPAPRRRPAALLALDGGVEAGIWPDTEARRGSRPRRPVRGSCASWRRGTLLLPDGRRTEPNAQLATEARANGVQ
ncbi:hypothetical protein [Streptomyces sp. TRM68367]|uniref:hypothetical protein n=1 Tax=Streptomyces sp. TRM68367 TaxID=2758415 RepID=UPI00165BDDB9|nr:hypothetical protein [Streptomyces sp. TRM68367]MBC9725806.1 hypothetical protein [Streptomyces sp. TRM68367]